MSNVDHEFWADVIERSGDYRVLRRFEPKKRYANAEFLPPPPLGPQLFTGLIADCETTGLDPEDDKIIQVAGLEFTYDANGIVYDVKSDFTFVEDPGVPIDPDVARRSHGLTDDDVKGRHIDDKTVTDTMRRANLVIAHNADFDRRRFERRFGIVAASTPWACSQREVPWDRHVPAIAGAKLIHLLEQGCHQFYQAHRALDDCYATLHVLTQSIEGKPAFLHLLESARQPTFRVFAVGTEFYMTKYLKARRTASNEKYRWSDGKDGRTKAWFVDVKRTELAEEKAWLASPKIRCYRPKVEQFDALSRYSTRMDV